MVKKWSLYFDYATYYSYFSYFLWLKFITCIKTKWLNGVKVLRKAIHRAYVYSAKCIECNKSTPVYVTLPDFGDPPIIKKCKFCDTLYWYSPEDIYYKKPLEKQIEGKNCAICAANLCEALVPTHTHIKCCNTEYSLDDDFINLVDLDYSVMEDVEVYLVYV